MHLEDLSPQDMEACVMMYWIGFIFGFSIVWIVSGIISAGLWNAVLRRKWPTIYRPEHTKQEIIEALIRGPIGLTATIGTIREFKSYRGWTLSRKPINQ